MRHETQRPIFWLMVLGPLLLCLACPEPTERYGTDEPRDMPPDGDADADGDRDADVAGEDGSVDGGDAGEGDEPCLEEATFCLDNQIHRCQSDGTGTELILDCTEPPFAECRLDFCSPGLLSEHPCCISEAPLCDALVTVSGEEPLEISSLGYWDDGYACKAYIVEEGEFTYRVEAENDVCEEGYLRIIVNGDLADLSLGEATAICDGDSSPFRVDVYMSRYDDASGEWLLDTFLVGNCEGPGGTLTLTEWGDTAGSPFELSLEVSLYDGGSGAMRALSVTSNGLIVLYE